MRKLTEEELNGSASDSSDYSSSSSTSSVNCSPAGTLRMAARAILTCRPNSHPFQERNVSLEQPVKIGRSVARARPNGSNAIFDCKVLSRNHALLWHENGKFFLQDTKSSNGTFVNNQRLSKSSEESSPREVCSGDIVQFGVDVMEVNKKLTHGCIVANLQLFLPDGKEAKASSSTALPDKAPSTSLQEIYQLNQFIRDAMQKEQLIENKLAAISKLMVATKESMAVSWKSLIEEDRLLTRIDIMERQMQTSHKAMTDDKLKEEVNQLYVDKEKYQNVAKEALRKSMQEKMDLMKNHQELERNLSNWEEEKVLLKDMCEKTAEELKELAEKYEKSELKSKELEEEIDTSSTKYKEEVETLNKKLKEGEDLLIDKQKVIDALIAKMDLQVARSILTAHNDDTKIILPENDSNKLLENECLDGEKASQNNSISENMNNKNGEMENLKSQLVIAESEKKEIQSRLIQMLNLFEDLKAVSNKVQVSEYLSELIGKVDMEIHQIKNFIHGDDGLKNSYSITDEMNELRGENHVNRRNSDGDSGLEKLLEESRETIKTLQSENTAAKRQSESFQEKFSICAIDLERYKRQVEAISEANSELKSQVNYLNEKLTHSDQNEEENSLKLRTQAGIIEANERLIDTLKGEVSALNGLLKDREENFAQISFSLKDLNVVKPEPEVLEVACQTVKELLSAQKVALGGTSQAFEDAISGASNKSNGSVVEIDLVALKDKLLQTEEELAVFKDRYNECSVECLNLNRKVFELKSEHDTLADQSKLVQLRFIIPIAIFILAILIAFHPSS